MAITSCNQILSDAKHKIFGFFKSNFQKIHVASSRAIFPLKFAAKDSLKG
jgi:hypothetical protein